MELSSQQVICPYCGGVIQSEFYDWQTEVFEIYEKMGANMQYRTIIACLLGHHVPVSDLVPLPD